MFYQQMLLVWLLLVAALSASSGVEAKKQTKAGKKADLGVSKCTNGKKGKKCKLKRTKDKDIFAADDISIQLEADGIMQEFVGGSRQGGKNKHPQWYGVSEDNFAMNLIESDGKLYGSYSDNDFIYSISTDDDGNPMVTGKLTSEFPDELDDADLNFETFSGNHTDGEDPGKGETNNDNSFGHESMRKLGLRGRSASSSFRNTTERELAEAHTTLDIMVVWTKTAECKNSKKKKRCKTTEATKAAMLGLIDLAIAETNVAFEESGVQITVRLVHAYRQSYTENDMSKALNYITGNGGIRRKRAKYGADLVAMILHEPSYCGMAWLGPNKNRMFSVSHWECATGYFSFGHEIGHNMGCNHDRGTKNKCSDSKNGHYAFRDHNAGFRSILAYNCRRNQCDNIQGNYCRRVQRFSNPTYKYGGKRIGTKNTANNAAQLNSVRTRVGKYFAEVPLLSPPMSSMPSSLPSSSTAPSSEPSKSSAPSLSRPPSVQPSNNPSTSSEPSDQPSDQPSVTPIWTEIFAQGFESGFGEFQDDGSDARRYSGGRYSHTGSKSLELRDDTKTSLSYTNPFTVSSYSTLKVEFWYKSRRFKQKSDSFSLESSTGDTGTDWVTRETWSFRVTDGFNKNNRWRYASVEFPIDTTTMRIQFKNNGDKNNEKIYIDDVTVSGN